MAPSPEQQNDCSHNEVRVEHDSGPTLMGRAVCRACGAQRLFEGNHDGPWAPAGEEPSWDVEQTPAGGS